MFYLNENRLQRHETNTRNKLMIKGTGRYKLRGIELTDTNYI